MIYSCDKCRFVFERINDVIECPNCGKSAVRKAEKLEQEEYLKNRMTDDSTPASQITEE